MKKLLMVMLLVCSASAFAKTVSWEKFQQRVFEVYPWVDYIDYSVYEKWEGDVDAFLNYLYKNGCCSL